MLGLFSQNNLLLCGMQGNNALLGKKFRKSKINIQPAGSHFCITSSCRVFEWTLKELPFNIIKSFLFIFIYGFVKFLKAFDTRGILSTITRDVHVRLIKTNSKAIKIAKETTNNK